MADQKDDNKQNLTQEEIREANLKFSDDDINKGIDLLKKQGYITKKDIKNMDDTVWADGFKKAIDDKVQGDEKWNPYIYVEKFDFKGGKIDSIIFDMDQVTTRKAASEKLADVTNQKIIR